MVNVSNYIPPSEPPPGPPSSPPLPWLLLRRSQPTLVRSIVLSVSFSPVSRSKSGSAHRTNAFLIVAKRATRDVDDHAKPTTAVARQMRMQIRRKGRVTAPAFDNLGHYVRLEKEGERWHDPLVLSRRGWKEIYPNAELARRS